MIYKTKSVVIGRMKRKSKDDTEYPCFISLFYAVNDPHKSGLAPDKILQYEKVHKVVIEGLVVNYLPLGNDIVINELEEIDVMVNGPHIFLRGKQNKI
ncbi:MAG: hypothetical protein QXK37_04110 [Candidatus Woesearchaeota archaeon]